MISITLILYLSVFIPERAKRMLFDYLEKWVGSNNIPKIQRLLIIVIVLLNLLFFTSLLFGSPKQHRKTMTNDGVDNKERDYVCIRWGPLDIECWWE